jgi:hypothetical protein
VRLTPELLDLLASHPQARVQPMLELAGASARA